MNDDLENEYIDPVKPDSMALVFVYHCPVCGSEHVLVSPVQPYSVNCGFCRSRFPIVPVDEKTVKYVYTMLGNGKAAIDPDYC